MTEYQMIATNLPVDGKITCKMTDAPTFIESREYRDVIDGFTIGRGKTKYHYWKPGPCGLYYCFRFVDDQGHVGCRRAVEPTQLVTIHLIEKP